MYPLLFLSISILGTHGMLSFEKALDLGCKGCMEVWVGVVTDLQLHPLHSN